MSIRRVLVIGSGPVVIGQAAEFDYSGTQACRALAEEGVEVVLVNSNPATIMTDATTAARVYVEPLTVDTVARIIARERPDGILPTVGGQTALNLAVALAREGVLDRHGARLLGTPLRAIERGEDRALFRRAMEEIGAAVPASETAGSVAEAVAIAGRLGYPVVVRPAYTLGGSGGGIAADEGDLRDVARRGLAASPARQVLIEQSVAGWKEIEYEVIRDGADTCLVVCNMENVDPMGVHTGDSVVVAPSQTLSDDEYQRLRSAAIAIIRHLGIEGGCNIQFALDPQSDRFAVIEVNPRLSRSSALASKATGYPIARVAAKIALGLRLDEIRNAVTGVTTAAFEPALDYVVAKVPRWPFDKFRGLDPRLGTQMKSTGEAMAIGRTFEEALQKALRATETECDGLHHPGAAAWSDAEAWARIDVPCPERMHAVAEALRRGAPVEAINARTGIDPYFLARIAAAVATEAELRAGPASRELLRRAKRQGFSDAGIARLTGETADRVRARREAWGIRRTYKAVDTCAGEFPAATPYFYGTFEEEDEAAPAGSPRVLVVGSGPIRIGQGIEFDYSSVHAARAIREAGGAAVLVNSNPETVSTDFDVADRLYFEPLDEESVLDVARREGVDGAIVQVGGQTALNLAAALHRAGVPILGTPLESIDLSEDRARFHRLLRHLRIPCPAAAAARSVEAGMRLAGTLGLPLVVRPSYVIGGRGMEIVEDERDLRAYLEAAFAAAPGHPVLIDQYLPGLELEADAISDGANVLVPGIMEHVERAGVHSGDSVAIFPAVGAEPRHRDDLVAATVRLARALGVRGFINVQAVVHGGRLRVLEANLRASRTVPFVSKAAGVPLVEIATRVMLGASLAQFGYAGTTVLPPPARVSVKAPVFSMHKLPGADPALGPEMRSTGEVMGHAPTADAAVALALRAAGLVAPEGTTVLAAVADHDKPAAAGVLRRFAQRGRAIAATPGTAAALADAGVPVARVVGGADEVRELLRSGRVGLVVNSPSRRGPDRALGRFLRQEALDLGIPCLTSVDTAAAYLTLLEAGTPEPVPLPGPRRGSHDRRPAGILRPSDA